VKPSITNIRGLNLAVVKLMTVLVTRQPLQHMICKIGMIYSAKPKLTQGLYIVHKEVFNNMIYLRYVHLTKFRHIQRGKPIVLSERILHKDYDRKGSIGKQTLAVSLKLLGAKAN
jgi:hypothetical protein